MIAVDHGRRGADWSRTSTEGGKDGSAQLCEHTSQASKQTKMVAERCFGPKLRRMQDILLHPMGPQTLRRDSFRGEGLTLSLYFSRHTAHRSGLLYRASGPAAISQYRVVSSGRVYILVAQLGHNQASFLRRALKPKFRVRMPQSIISTPLLA